MIEQRTQRITVGARLFALVALSGPILWDRNETALTALAGVAGVWVVASVAEQRRELTVNVPVVEAALTGVVCGLTFGDGQAILLALAVPPFLAAVVRGLLGTFLAISAELVTVVGLALLIQHSITAQESLTIFTWTMAGLGLGMVGSFVYANLATDVDELAPYLDAQRLIRQLLDLSGNLSSGLDVTALAGALVSDVGDQLPTVGIAVYVPRGEVLMPLVSQSVDVESTLAEAEELAVESWARSEPIVHDLAFAFPVGDSVVVAGLLSEAADLDVIEVERTILRLPAQLRAKSVQLDTAMLFSDFRDSASADVRKRLAREMHDGVAQDIASLGYLVDALAARPADDKQAKALALLRDRITKVVAEVRQSVLTLRTSIGESETLGVAIGAVARHLSESSMIPIQVTLDEHSTRLRPEVEAELFRITQEAMNNAIKHAQCSSIEVNCQVHAPSAHITVADDGRGLQAARSDSHGLKIMRERARLVGAELTIDDNPQGGLMVAVRIP
ncbi:histidine kinase [Nocardioides sp.]|uniref:sensor histidine kinase n=1 Tax=Nocardioides sp. TaxID=35761 RepID=UPI0027156F95|nr:histidine kinase [Nocardioides sp.]MDO9458446.1 histidine kinase [Nocardioides sp.]